MTSGLDKYALIALPDAELLRRCRCEACRGTGPGGQKRNKTSSAVRLTHLDSGIAVVDDATRSQHLNLANALRKLRLELSVALPAPIAAPPQPPLEPVPRTHSAAHALWPSAARQAAWQKCFHVTYSSGSASRNNGSGSACRHLTTDPD